MTEEEKHEMHLVAQEIDRELEQRSLMSQEEKGREYREEEEADEDNFHARNDGRAWYNKKS